MRCTSSRSNGFDRNAVTPSRRASSVRLCTADRITTGACQSEKRARADLEELPPVHERHHQIEEDEVGQRRLEARERLIAVGCCLHVEAFLADGLGERAQDVGVILDNEDVSAHTQKLGVLGRPISSPVGIGCRILHAGAYLRHVGVAA